VLALPHTRGVDEWSLPYPPGLFFFADRVEGVWSKGVVQDRPRHKNIKNERMCSV